MSVRPVIQNLMAACWVVIAGATIAATTLSPGMVRADSWLPARETAYFSSDKSVRLTVKPRELRNALGYFEDQIDGKPQAGQRPGGVSQARGVLERRDDVGAWTPVWDQPLVNDVAPVSALVANGGEFVVTFDNWHHAGLGEHVIVIYDRHGLLIRSMRLTDILPEDYVEALPRSVSSVWWGGDHEISDHTLILKVVIPGEDVDRSRSRFVDVEIDLASGQRLASDDAAWNAALVDAAKRKHQIDLAEAARVTRMREPLLGPDSTTDREWHRYLEEAYFRLAPDWNDGYPAIKVLRLPGARDYAPSLGWLRDALAKDFRGDGTLMFASADQTNLTNVLVDTAKDLKAGQLRGVRVYFAVDSAHWTRLSQAFAVSGAELIQLDPAKPIPQRPERLP